MGILCFQLWGYALVNYILNYILRLPVHSKGRLNKVCATDWQLVLFRWSIITDHRLVSSNDQALDYDVELSIISQNYVIKKKIASTKITNANVTMLSIKNNVGIRQILIYIPNWVMVDINPSSHRPRADILKMASLPRTYSAIHHRSVRPNRRLIVKMEPIPDYAALHV